MSKNYNVATAAGEDHRSKDDQDFGKALHSPATKASAAAWRGFIPAF
ncbi:MAG: hypothetical protein ACLQF1_20000 [Methyloceanibacter sp.]